MAKQTIKSIKLSTGTELTFPAFELSNCEALSCINYSSKGNLQITTLSASTTKINIEPDDNLAIKPGGKIQLDTSHRKYPYDDFKVSDDPKTDELEVAVVNGDIDKAADQKKHNVEGLKLTCASIKIANDDLVDTNNGWDSSKFPVYFKKTTGEVDTWTKVVMHGASFDVRARSTGPGTGGGIALQPCYIDSDGFENKFKIETSRKVDVFNSNTNYFTTENGSLCKVKDKVVKGTNATYFLSSLYETTGGDGIEIGTINSNFESFYTREMRRAAKTELFAVTRNGPGAMYELDGDYDFGISSLVDSNPSCTGFKTDKDVIWDIDGVWYVGNNAEPTNTISCDYVIDPDGSQVDWNTFIAEQKIKKYDYGTQDDDTKDVKQSPISRVDQSTYGNVYWIDLINAALYLKNNGLIPNNGAANGYYFLGESEAKYKHSSGDDTTTANTATITQG